MYSIQYFCKQLTYALHSSVTKLEEIENIQPPLVIESFIYPGIKGSSINPRSNVRSEGIAKCQKQLKSILTQIDSLFYRGILFLKATHNHLFSVFSVQCIFQKKKALYYSKLRQFLIRSQVTLTKPTQGRSPYFKDFKNVLH